MSKVPNKLMICGLGYIDRPTGIEWGVWGGHLFNLTTWLSHLDESRRKMRQKGPSMGQLTPTAIQFLIVHSN